MINVNEVYLDARKLAGKDKAGYFNSDEFNRFSILAESMLWRFYVKHFEEHGAIADSMRQFNDLAVVSLDSNSRFSLPSDFGRRGVLWWMKKKNGQSVARVKIQYLEKEELQDTLDSPIRGPLLSKNRLYYTFVAGKCQVYPAITGPVEMDYLRNPTYAVRGYTLNGTTLEEDYNAGTSTQYEWPENERPNIVDLILLQYGLILRETQVISFAQMEIQKQQNQKQL